MWLNFSIDGCRRTIKAPVSGIAMGLIKEDDKVTILTDIQGMEDF